MSKPITEKSIIGWREWLDFTEWGIRLKGKIDTGARSSSIDVEHIEELEGNRLRFTIRLSRKKNNFKVVEAEISRISNVRSSNGEKQKRYFVLTPICMAGVNKTIEMSLACRKKMLHRVLLGREALSDDFLIDAGVDHLTTPTGN